MKVFIAWSGELSKSIAELLRKRLPEIIQAVDPFISTHDIGAGTRWLETVSSELEDTNIGLLCVTPENAVAPWLLFEAGALAKKVETARVIPLLVKMKLSELRQPLAIFEGREFSRDGVFAILESIKNALPEDRHLEDDILRTTFNRVWPEIEEEYLQILEEAEKGVAEESGRDTQDMVEEILETVRALAREREPEEEVIVWSSPSAPASGEPLFPYRVIRSKVHGYGTFSPPEVERAIPKMQGGVPELEDPPIENSPKP